MPASYMDAGSCPGFSTYDPSACYCSEKTADDKADVRAPAIPVGDPDEVLGFKLASPQPLQATGE